MHKAYDVGWCAWMNGTVPKTSRTQQGRLRTTIEQQITMDVLPNESVRVISPDREKSLKQHNHHHMLHSRGTMAITSLARFDMNADKGSSESQSMAAAW